MLLLLSTLGSLGGFESGGDFGRGGRDLVLDGLGVVEGLEKVLVVDVT